MEIMTAAQAADRTAKKVNDKNVLQLDKIAIVIYERCEQGWDHTEYEYITVEIAEHLESIGYNVMCKPTGVWVISWETAK